ncbi:hypothetical protein OSTOST_16029 [Ostertagia ostertagi]
MSMSAGWGLDFLHTAGIIHRDLAARNCFYDKQLHDLATARRQNFLNCFNIKVKISGFGLARKTDAYVQKSMRRMMIKWMAPETVAAFRFSKKSDVYMYGSLPIVHQYFAAPVLKDADYKEEGKTAPLASKIRTLPMKKGTAQVRSPTSPRVATPNSRTPRGRSERALGNSARRVVREDKARPSPTKTTIKVEPSAVDRNKERVARVFPELPPRKLEESPRPQAKKPEYENLVAFGAAVAYAAQKAGKKAPVQQKAVQVEEDEPASMRPKSPPRTIEQKIEKSADVKDAATKSVMKQEDAPASPEESPVQKKTEEPLAVQKKAADRAEVNDGTVEVVLDGKKNLVEEPNSERKPSPNEEPKQKKKAPGDEPTSPDPNKEDE